MWRTFIIMFVLIVARLTCTQAKNIIYSENIKSLTSVVNNDWQSSPVLVLGKGDVMRIGFDEMSHDYHRFIYRIEHCEKDWSTSEELFDSDWLVGFNGLPIEDYQNSINTNVLYTHYGFTFPNSQCGVKMSGNYRMGIYDENDGDQMVAEVRFRVVEPLMAVRMEMTTNTDIDVNKSHQQVNISLEYGSINITNPDEEISLYVTQNNREETAREGLSANYRSNKGLTWSHNKALIFSAGNEYHKFEVLDVSHPTMGIDNIVWDGEAYQVYPFACMPRRNYLYDEDANGAFLIRNSDNVEVDYISEYVYVNYELHSPFVGEMMIDGMWTTDSDKNHYLMEYDEESQTYRSQQFQKQGYYNYIYTTTDGSVAPLEGSFYETDNSYQVYIYYKGIGERTWRIIGFAKLH